jgi:uncharacterized protein YndB with AHSA1/START domain
MSKRSVTHSTFVIEHVYDASPARVFQGFADPEIKARWFSGPEDWETTEESLDFRVGGKEVNVGGPKGGPHSAFRATYLNIVPDERIIYSYDMDLDGVPISVSVTTVELRPNGTGTRLVLTEQGAYLDDFDDPAGREEGTLEALRALEAVLLSQAAQ